jgi:hypothetical protein
MDPSEDWCYFSNLAKKKISEETLNWKSASLVSVCDEFGLVAFAAGNEVTLISQQGLKDLLSDKEPENVIKFNIEDKITHISISPTGAYLALAFLNTVKLLEVPALIDSSSNTKEYTFDTPVRHIEWSKSNVLGVLTNSLRLEFVDMNSKISHTESVDAFCFIKNKLEFFIEVSDQRIKYRTIQSLDDIHILPLPKKAFPVHLAHLNNYNFALVSSDQNEISLLMFEFVYDTVAPIKVICEVSDVDFNLMEPFDYLKSCNHESLNGFVHYIGEKDTVLFSTSNMNAIHVIYKHKGNYVPVCWDENIRNKARAGWHEDWEHVIRGMGVLNAYTADSSEDTFNVKDNDFVFKKTPLVLYVSSSGEYRLARYIDLREGFLNIDTLIQPKPLEAIDTTIHFTSERRPQVSIQEQLEERKLHMEERKQQSTAQSQEPVRKQLEESKSPSGLFTTPSTNPFMAAFNAANKGESVFKPGTLFKAQQTPDDKKIEGFPAFKPPGLASLSLSPDPFKKAEENKAAQSSVLAKPDDKNLLFKSDGPFSSVFAKPDDKSSIFKAPSATGKPEEEKKASTFGTGGFVFGMSENKTEAESVFSKPQDIGKSFVGTGTSLFRKPQEGTSQNNLFAKPEEQKTNLLVSTDASSVFGKSQGPMNISSKPEEKKTTVFGTTHPASIFCKPEENKTTPFETTQPMNISTKPEEKKTTLFETTQPANISTKPEEKKTSVFGKPHESTLPTNLSSRPEDNKIIPQEDVSPINLLTKPEERKSTEPIFAKPGSTATSSIFSKPEEKKTTPFGTVQPIFPKPEEKPAKLLAPDIFPKPEETKQPTFKLENPFALPKLEEQKNAIQSSEIPFAKSSISFPSKPAEESKSSPFQLATSFQSALPSYLTKESKPSTTLLQPKPQDTVSKPNSGPPTLENLLKQKEDELTNLGKTTIQTTASKLQEADSQLSYREVEDLIRSKDKLKKTIADLKKFMITQGELLDNLLAENIMQKKDVKSFKTVLAKLQITLGRREVNDTDVDPRLVRAVEEIEHRGNSLSLFLTEAISKMNSSYQKQKDDLGLSTSSSVSANSIKVTRSFIPRISAPASPSVNPDQARTYLYRRLDQITELVQSLSKRSSNLGKILRPSQQKKFSLDDIDSIETVSTESEIEPSYELDYTEPEMLKQNIEKMIREPMVQSLTKPKERGVGSIPNTPASQISSTKLNKVSTVNPITLDIKPISLFQTTPPKGPERKENLLENIVNKNREIQEMRMKHERELLTIRDDLATNSNPIPIQEAKQTIPRVGGSDNNKDDIINKTGTIPISATSLTQSPTPLTQTKPAISQPQMGFGSQTKPATSQSMLTAQTKPDTSQSMLTAQTKPDTSQSMFTPQTKPATSQSILTAQTKPTTSQSMFTPQTKPATSQPQTSFGAQPKPATSQPQTSFVAQSNPVFGTSPQAGFGSQPQPGFGASPQTGFGGQASPNPSTSPKNIGGFGAQPKSPQPQSGFGPQSQVQSGFGPQSQNQSGFGPQSQNQSGFGSQPKSPTQSSFNVQSQGGFGQPTQSSQPISGFNPKPATLQSSFGAPQSSTNFSASKTGFGTNTGFGQTQSFNQPSIAKVQLPTNKVFGGAPSGGFGNVSSGGFISSQPAQSGQPQGFTGVNFGSGQAQSGFGQINQQLGPGFPSSNMPSNPGLQSSSQSFFAPRK